MYKNGFFFIIIVLLCIRSSNSNNFFFIHESKKGGAVPGKKQTGLMQASHMNDVKVTSATCNLCYFSPRPLEKRLGIASLLVYLLQGCVYHAFL